MGTNLRVKDLILHGESEGKTYYDIIQAGYELQGARHQEEWLWEDGAWRLNLSPVFKLPGAGK